MLERSSRKAWAREVKETNLYAFPSAYRAYEKNTRMLLTHLVVVLIIKTSLSHGQPISSRYYQ